MAKVGVSLNIDVTKVDKAHIFEGKKGKYLTMTAFIDLDEQDQYGNNGMITQKFSQEIEAQMKEKGERAPILGNSKVFWSETPQPQAPVATAPSFDDATLAEDSPF